MTKARASLTFWTVGVVLSAFPGFLFQAAAQ
jgi:hypothetical protein